MNVPLTQIPGFYRVSEHIATAAQPQAEHFDLVHAAGFYTVINLALRNSPKAIINEADLVEQLGMIYVHIPVDFDTPKIVQLETFFRSMQQHRQPLFIHCVMNWRSRRISISLSSYCLLFTIDNSQITS